MKKITLGKTGITTGKNGFGALPIQRISKEDAVRLLRRALEGGINYFDTARAYSDSEEKLGAAFEGHRNEIFIATKTTAKDSKTFWSDLETSLKNLKTDHVDIYQLHMADKCYAPGDESGLYEALLEAKKKGMILHIGITAHKIKVAEEIVESGLYETLQYPFNYLSTDRETALVENCLSKSMGFISMKALSGGLINNAKAAYAHQDLFEGVLPIWGIQKMEELEEFISFINNSPTMDDEIRSIIEKDKRELAGNFCRGCGYCQPCPQGITIFNCARMSLMLRRAPQESWLSDHWQGEMKKIENCTGCGTCKTRCPYGLDIPNLLKENYKDYKSFL